MNKNSDGFSLIELIVAMAIFGLMVTGVINLFVGIDTLQRRAQRIEIATRAAEAQIESLRNSHYNSLESGETIDFSDELPQSLPAPRTGEVVVSEPIPGMKQLEVTVEYAQQPQDYSVTLTGLMGTIGIAQ